MPGVRDNLRAQQQNCCNGEGYVLVKYVAQKTDYCYTGNYYSVEDPGLRATSFKVRKKDGTLFKPNETDV